MGRKLQVNAAAPAPLDLGLWHQYEADVTMQTVAGLALAAVFVASTAAGLVSQWNWSITWQVALFAILFLFGLAITYFLVDGYQSRKEALRRAMTAEPLWVEYDEPPEIDPPVITTGVDYAPEMIGGIIDARDLEFFCKWLASGGSWAENVWEGKDLPFGYHISKIGSADSPSSYDRLLALFLNCHPPVIINRDGEKRRKGELTTTDPQEMLRRLRRMTG